MPPTKLNYDGFSDTRHEIGPIMYPIHFPKDKHYRFYSATQSRMQESDPLANTTGSTCIIDGDIFYSPNARRPLLKVPATGDAQIQLDSRYDSLDVIRQPLWWSMDYAHVAFLQVNSIQQGAFGWALHTPEYHWRKKDKTFSMRSANIIRWHRLERDLKLFMSSLSELGNVPPSPCVIERAFTCGGIYTSNEQLKQDIIRCRDWYSYWLCRLSYVIAVCDTISMESKNTGSASVSFAWLQSMVQQDWYQGFIATVNATCGVFDCSVERVGVILDVVAPKPMQFSVEWLVHYGIPVWYRWGQREISACQANEDLIRLAPRVASIQHASTVISQTPIDVPPQTVDPMAVVNVFITERNKRTKQMEQTESQESKNRRKQRDEAGGFRRIKVFVWEKDEQGVYKRQAVTQADKIDTLNFYGRDQKIYSSIFGEWDCCSAFGDKTEEECEEEDELNDMEYGDWDDHPREPEEPLTTSNTTQSQNICQTAITRPNELKGYTTMHGQPSLLSEEALDSTEVDRFEAIHIMYEYMGYVAPLTHETRPNANNPSISDSNRVMYSNLLGKDIADHDFFDSFVSAPALDFLDRLCSKDNRPLPETWDLYKDCRYPLAGSWRAKLVKQIKGNGTTIFMLDMGVLSTVAWRIGVTTAAAALLICRLDKHMSDYEICRHLLQRGIPFKVLMCLDKNAVRPSYIHRPPHIPLRTPGYEFTKHDYISYCSDKRAILRDHNLAKKALKTGGIVWRLSLECSFDTVLSDGWRYDQSQMADVYSDSQGCNYFDDKCTDEEIEAICGAYKCAQADHPETQIKSWWPSDKTWKNNVAYPFWTEYTEAWYSKRLKSIQDGEASPLTQHQWRNYIRKNSKQTRLSKTLETHSNKFLESLIAGGL